MTSIRLRLFAILLATTGAVWLFAVVWTYVNTQAEVERVLDARLTEAARMVSSLITDHHIDVAAAVDAANAREASGVFEQGEGYSRQLSCQIWSLQGTLVSRSESAPVTSLADHREGFAETEINGERWRVFAVINPTLGVRVLVGDSLEIRERLVGGVIKGLLLPALVILPMLALLIWLSVCRGLAPLNRIAASLSSRSATELHPLPEAPAPREVRPMIAALNSLFRRVEDVRVRESDFTAYAAHELKTPLAGLKTQAQIAMRSEDPDTRRQALSQILSSVDRTSRMVRQLIDMARVDARDDVVSRDQVDVMRLIEELSVELSPVAAQRRVQIAVRSDGEQAALCIATDRTLLRLILRNLLENALQHAPPGTQTICTTRAADDSLTIQIDDFGPGMTADEQTRSADRFYRGPLSAPSGSGLGLSIVQMAIERLGGSLDYRNREEGGLSVAVTLKRSAA
ncbi:MAG: sensor histidine kinase N-terminal domain-containing protein [Alphaproteobacteria bacterium]|nr:sensor histidine kinase N-terminal domain-containing protein [Alphaproteobacteria bacterium]